VGETIDGGLAEYCRSPEHQLIEIPDGVSYEQAASLPVAYGTAHRMMVTRGEVNGDDRVLIMGASGGVGTGALLLAKILGAEVVALSSSEVKMRALTDMGADHVINYLETDWVKEIWKLYTKPHRRKYEGGVTVVVNFTGGDTWVPGLRVLHRGGRVLTCGATAGYDPAEDLRFIWSYELKVLGANGWLREDLTTLIEMLGDGSLKPIIDTTLPLEEVNEAFRLLEDRVVFGKVVLTP